MIPYPPKDPNEVLKNTVDWADRLGDEVIVNSVFELEQAGGCTITSEANDDTTATVIISGGTNGEACVFVNTVTTATQTMQEAGVFFVQDVTLDPVVVPATGQHVLDAASFRQIFPAFQSEEAYPYAVLNLFWGNAVGFLGDYDGCFLRGAALQSALNYLTAHLVASNDILRRGQTPSIVTGSTVDKIQVQRMAPPVRNAWQWWLATTPYGLALWALLKAQSAGGFYIGGRPERAAFRKVGGRF